LYEQLLHQYPLAKKSQSRTVIREKLHKALLYKKATRKMLAKLTPAESRRIRKGGIGVGWQRFGRSPVED